MLSSKIKIMTSLRVLFPGGCETRGFIGQNQRKARGIGTPRGRRVEMITI